MKSCEQFYASVYAKAETKRKAIEARNRKIRNFSVTAACVLAVAAAAVPASRLLSADQPSPHTIVENQVEQAPLFAGGDSARMVLLYGPEEKQPVIVLNNKEEKKAFVSKYKEANRIGETEGLPVTKSYDAAKTIHTADEFKEFLTALPQDTQALREAIGDYDDSFFSENDLCAELMEIRPGEASAEEAVSESSAATEPLTQIAEEETTVPDAEERSPAEGAEPVTEPAQAEELFTLSKLQLYSAEVYLLLLVPMTK